MILLFGWTWFFRFVFSIQRDHCSLLFSFSFLFLSRGPVVLPATLTLGSHDFAIVIADVVCRSVLTAAAFGPDGEVSPVGGLV